MNNKINYFLDNFNKIFPSEGPRPKQYFYKVNGQWKITDNKWLALRAHTFFEELVKDLIDWNKSGLSAEKAKDLWTYAERFHQNYKNKEGIIRSIFFRSIRKTKRLIFD